MNEKHDIFYVIETEDGEEYYFKTIRGRDKFIESGFWKTTYYDQPYRLGYRKIYE